MHNDYERYDFWHREMAAIKPSERSMKKLVESNNRFDEKMANPSEDRRSEDISGYATSIITNSMLLG